MKFLFLILALTMLISLFSPISNASIPIQVTNQVQNQKTYGNQVNQQYTFVLNQSTFNYTETFGNFTNQSIFQSTVEGTFLVAPFTTQKTFIIRVDYNNTHYWQMTFTYVPEDLLFVSYWNAYYSLVKDGQEVCHDTNRYQSTIFGAESITPIPDFTFDFNLHGSYNSVSSATSFDNGNFSGGGIFSSGTNVSGEVLYDSPSLYLTFNDNVASPLNILDTFSLNPCAAGEGQGQGYWQDFDTHEITGPITLSMSTFDNIPYDQNILYQFQNRGTTLNATLSEINQINQNLPHNSCTSFTILGLCIGDFLSSIFRLVLQVASIPITLIMSVIPGGDAITNLVQIGLASISDTFNFLGTLMFTTAPGIPIGGALYFITIYNLSLGFTIYAITGDAFHIIGIPYWFLKIYVIIVIALTYGLFFWLPMQIYRFFAEAIP